MHFATSLTQSSRDIRLLWFSVFVRMMSFGLTNQVLTLYLKELKLKESYIGAFMSLTMVGDTLLSYLLVWYSHRIGNRRVMLIGSFMMFVAGATFSSGTNSFPLLLTAAVIGVISPSGDETGPFKSIEEATLAKLTPPNHRPEVFAIHSVMSAAGASLGSLLGGLSVQYMVTKLQWSYALAYQRAFVIYCLISLLKFTSMLLLSYKCEPSYVPNYELTASQAIQRSDSSQSATETSPLLTIRSTVEHQTLTGLSPQTQRTLLKLLLSFGMDSFGYGFMPLAWVVYYFKFTFQTPAAVLGGIFSAIAVLQSLSAFPSAWFAKNVGPIKTSLLTQIPCGLFFVAIPLFGKNMVSATIFLILNQSISGFDVVPRQVLLSSVSSSDELPKILGTVNLVKTAMRSISPYFTGIFAQHGLLWVCFVLSASLLIAANILLWFNFPNLDEEVRKNQSQDHVID